MKNDLVVHKSNGKDIIVDSSTKTIAKVLLTREKIWDESQKSRLHSRIQLKCKKSQKAKDYAKKNLQDCKSWMGPCTSAEELLNILKVKPDKVEFIVRTEMAYYTHCHKQEKLQQHELFKLNGISYEEKLTNLCTLLSSDLPESTKTVANLPTNNDIFQALVISKISTDVSESDIQINRLCTIIWKNETERYEWYLGYIKEKIEEKYIVDHLHRVTRGSDVLWNYPTTEDIQTVEREQILPMEIKGDWNMERNNKFVLKNINEVIVEFENILKTYI